MSKRTAEELYARLSQIMADMPNLLTKGPISPETNRWLARAFALVEEVGHSADAVSMKFIADRAGTNMALSTDAQQVAAIVNRALVRAEMAAPASMQGAFIPVGGFFDAFDGIGRVLATATLSVFMVDPYSDEKILTDYARLASDSVQFQVLAGQKNHKASLKPAVENWLKQFITTRPLEIRLAPDRQLHDRAIIVDAKTAWIIGQSFNKLAERAFTSIIRLPAEVGSEKIGSL